VGALAVTVARLEDEETMLQRLAPIVEMLQDEHPKVRGVVVRAFARIGPKVLFAIGLEPLIPLLTQAAEDEDPEVRKAAVEALTKMGLTIPGTPP